MYREDGEVRFPETHLYCTSTTDLESWTLMNVFDFVDPGLGTYQSQLVVVGGVQLPPAGAGDFTFSFQSRDEVLTSRDGSAWEASLPPLRTPRRDLVIVSVGKKTEYLVVAGGYTGVQDVPTVEVLVKGQWRTIQPLPIFCHVTRHCFHHGKLFLMPCVGDYLYLSAEHLVVYCEVETLLAHCAETAAGRTPPTDVLWKTVGTQHDVGFKLFDKYYPHLFPRFFISIGGCLVTAKGKHPPNCGWQMLAPKQLSPLLHVQWCLEAAAMSDFPWPHEVFVRSPSTKSWICVGEMPTSLERDVLTVFIPMSGEVVLIGSNGSKVFKVTLIGKTRQPAGW